MPNVSASTEPGTGMDKSEKMHSGLKHLPGVKEEAGKLLSPEGAKKPKRMRLRKGMKGHMKRGLVSDKAMQSAMHKHGMK